jgi:Flp pilus assembly pilin Flp
LIARSSFELQSESGLLRLSHSHCDLLKIYAKKNKHKGVTIVEYAIMLAMIAIAIAVASPTVTSAIIGVFNKASSVMNK